MDYRFTDPDGHPQALYYDTEWYQATDDKPVRKNQACRFPGHGVNVRRLDHINYVSASVDDNAAFARDVLGLEDTELIQLDNGKIGAHWFHFQNKWEPGGNRIELANAGARLILAPDWKPVVWTEAERKKGQAWGMQTISTFDTHGTPPVPPSVVE